MNIEKKLTLWQEAGLIDAGTRARIAAFEDGRHRPVLLYALLGLGALTIGIGIVSIVAANWDAIDRPIKLGIDLALGVLLAAGLFVAARRRQPLLVETLAAIDYVFVLASLALLGQVYQLGSPPHQALLVWSLCTLPFMTLVRTRFVGLMWLAGLIWTHVSTTAYWLETTFDRFGSHDTLLANIAVSIAYATAVLVLWLARTPFFASARPQISAGWTSTVWTAWLWASAGLGFLFYEDFAAHELLTWSLLVCGALSAGLVALLPRMYPALSARALLGMRIYVASTWLVLTLATALPHDDLPALGALVQVGLLGLAAWTVLQLGHLRLFNTLTGAIALRVLIMYFEVFGSMLDTGLGMITGGLLTLLLAWIWKRKSPELAARLGVEPGREHEGGKHVA